MFSLILAMAIFAQEAKPKPTPLKTQNFSGTWMLDMKKTKLKESSLVKSVAMSVLQTAKNLKIETETAFFTIVEKKSGEKRGDTGFGKPPSKTNTFISYTLDGKETDYQETGGIGNAKITAVIEKNGQLNLTQTRRFTMATGDKVLKTYEIWTLSEDGKTLNVWLSQDVIKGDFMEKKVVPEISQMVFTKK